MTGTLLALVAADAHAVAPRPPRQRVVNLSTVMNKPFTLRASERKVTVRAPAGTAIRKNDPQAPGGGTTLTPRQGKNGPLFDLEAGRFTAIVVNMRHVFDIYRTIPRPGPLRPRPMQPGELVPFPRQPPPSGVRPLPGSRPQPYSSRGDGFRASDV